jgi:hypothetical protein
MKQSGHRSQRWQRWRLEQRAAAWRRCRGVCEVVGCYDQADEGDHVFGRGHLVSEPLASHAAFMAGLCKTHHQYKTTHPGCPDELLEMHAAIERGYMLVGVSWFSVPLDRAEYVGEARQIEDMMKSGDQWAALLVESGRE